jgi:hypothetical protein
MAEFGDDVTIEVTWKRQPIATDPSLRNGQHPMVLTTDKA